MTNPTQLLSKEEVVAGWGAEICCLCETSHTVRASPLIQRKFARLGYKAVLGRAVADKFVVKDPLGSFRGLSKGVAVVSSLPVFGYEEQAIPPAVWESTRIVHCVVQVGRLPLHMIVLYLAPGARTGTVRYESNACVLASAAALIEVLKGPILLVGDWNSPATEFEVIRQLQEHGGFQDLALVFQRRTGFEPQPTCMGVTRHTFAYGNTEVVGLLREVQVRFPHDLDKHSVLCIDLDVPRENPYVMKWLTPKGLTGAKPDLAKLRVHVEARVAQVRAEIYQLMEQDNVDGALARWSEEVETAGVLSSSELPESQWKQFRGRCTQLVPVRVRVSPPRLKSGRSGDFQPGMYEPTLRIRQWTKQVRRLQDLERLIKAADAPGSRVRGVQLSELWRAICVAPGFQGGFQVFLQKEGFFVFASFPNTHWVKEVRLWLQDSVQSVIRANAQSGRRLFVAALDESWRLAGGSLPCKLIKDPQLPKLSELRIVRELRLAPQRWSPQGLEWVTFRDVSFLEKGDRLNGSAQVTVKEVAGNRVQLSARLTRREAAGLIWSTVSTDPNTWCKEVLDGWNQYWCRDEGDELPAEVGPYLERIGRHEPMVVPNLCLQDWKKALGRSKVHTMVGVDGFSVSDLQIVPDALVACLLDVFERIEEGSNWPTVCKKWLVILLRKEEQGLLTWGLVRPISVAGLLYRLWSKMRTMAMMKHACSLASPTVSPVLSTRSIWGLELDLLDRCVRVGVQASGFVLDVTKAFNILHRVLLKRLMIRYGFSEKIVDAWFAALCGMERQVLVGGAVYGSNVATTGVPEGDPMSVVAMFTFALFFRDVVRSMNVSVLPITFADNWEVFADSVDALVKVVQQLEPFLQAALLPVAPGKCWLWSISRSGRKCLRSVRWQEQRIPVVLSARVLGADVSYSFRKAAKVKNNRIRAGHRRFTKIAGLPMSRHQKVMLLFRSAYPQSLHAAEACYMPRSTARRMRARAVRATNLHGSGASPWLAAAVGAHEVFDPEWAVLLSRVRLFRQLVRDFPDKRELFQDCLGATRGRYHGSTRLMVKMLAELGWTLEGEEVFRDESGRRFHAVLSSFGHVESLLKTSWADKVVKEVKHRKGLEALQTLDLDASRPAKSLVPTEKGIMAALVTGRHFTRPSGTIS